MTESKAKSLNSIQTEKDLHLIERALLHHRPETRAKAPQATKTSHQRLPEDTNRLATNLGVVVMLGVEKEDVKNR